MGLTGLHFHDLRHTGNHLAAQSPGATLRDLMVPPVSGPQWQRLTVRLVGRGNVRRTHGGRPTTGPRTRRGHARGALTWGVRWSG